jgi:16S rRNA (uracil1498-N3)-methyltransferase
MKRYRFPIPAPAAVGQQVTLAETDARHIGKVLRLCPGDHIFLFDGEGTECEAVIDVVTPDAVTASVVSSATPLRESPVRIVAAQALLKEKKMDTVVRQLTELGVEACIPFPARRSVARPDPRKLAARVERWRKISVEAAKQSRRLKAPGIDPASGLDDVIARAEGFDAKIAFWEEAPVEAGWPAPGSSLKSVFLLTGPEGGMTGGEIGRLEAAGFVSASLGPRILRAETAAVVAAALAQHRYGDLGALRRKEAGKPGGREPEK